MNFTKLSKTETSFMRLILKNINAITDLCKDTGVRSKHSPYLVLDLNTDFFPLSPHNYNGFISVGSCSFDVLSRSSLILACIPAEARMRLLRLELNFWSLFFP